MWLPQQTTNRSTIRNPDEPALTTYRPMTEGLLPPNTNPPRE